MNSSDNVLAISLDGKTACTVVQSFLPDHVHVLYFFKIILETKVCDAECDSASFAVF